LASPDAATLTLNIYPVDGPRVWPYFAPFHYMSERFNGHRSWIVVTEDGEPVAFTSIIRFPHGHITNGWRGHRTVVLPDFQGLGIGGRLSDWTGEYVINHMPDEDGNPGRYFSRTVHPRFGAYRNASPLWKPTSSNEKVGSAPNQGISSTALMRLSFSHEYVGSGPARVDPKASARVTSRTRTRSRAKDVENTRDREPQGQANARTDAASRLRLRPYQRVGAAFLATAGSALLGDDMGVGKTAETIRALQLLCPDHRRGDHMAFQCRVFPVLVVCPSTVKHAWSLELAKWAPGLSVAVAGSGTAAVRKAVAGDADVTVVNYEALARTSRLAAYGSIRLTDEEKTPKELNGRYRTVIADEAHRIKDPKAKQTRALWAIGDDAEHRFALTGTPVANSPDDLWSIMRFVAPDEYAGKTRWVERYVDTVPNFWSGFADPVGFKAETRDEFDRIFLPRFLRRPKEAVLPELPPKTYMRRDVDMGAKQAKAYRQLRDSLIAGLDSGAILADNQLTQMVRLRQLACAYGEATPDGGMRLTEPSSKLDALEDVLTELGDRQVVVFAASRQLIELAHARILATRSAMTLTGSTPDDERALNIDGFQRGAYQVLLCTIAAGGVGITLTAADTAVFLERSWSMVDNAQAEDRIHRVGQERPVTIVDLVATDTVEDRVLEALADKQARLQDLVKDQDTVRRWLK
jgi:SNF2 family DNA or RNA helicase/GNAT superfamily N-acetyltransferase